MISLKKFAKERKKEIAHDLLLNKSLNTIYKHIREGKQETRYYKKRRKDIKQYFHDKELGLAKYYMDNVKKKKILQYIEVETGETSNDLTQAYLNDKLNDISQIVTKSQVAKSVRTLENRAHKRHKFDLRKKPEMAPIYDRFTTLNGMKKVIGDVNLSYDDALKVINGNAKSNMNLTKLYNYVDTKYHANNKEYILMLATGLYYVVDDVGNKTDNLRYFKMTFKKHIYVDMSDDDYALMLALQRGIVGDPKAQIYFLVLKEMKDIVVLHGQPKEIMNLPNWRISLMNKMLEDLDVNKNDFRDGYCLFDFIVKTMQDHGYKFDELILTTQLQKIGVALYDMGDFLNITPYDIKRWRDEFYPKVGIYCVDGMKNKVIHSPAPSSHQDFSICWVAHDKHCFPVTDHKITHDFSHSHENDTVKLGQTKYYVSYEDGYNVLDRNNILKFVNGKNDVYEFEDEKNDDFFKKKVCILSASMSKCHEIYDVLRKVIENNNMAVTQMNSGPSGLNSFVHPKTGQILVLNDNLQLRLDVLKKLKENFNCKQFDFNGQSLTTIAIDLRQRLIGEIPKSTYNDYVRSVFDTYHVTALIQTLCEDNKFPIDKIKGFDIIKCFSDVQLNMKDDYYAFDIHCQIEPYDKKEIGIGKFYIDNIKLPFKCHSESLLIKRGFYPYTLIQYLLDMKYICIDDIKYQCRAKIRIEGDLLKKYVKYCYDNFDSSVAKNLVNLHNGHLNTKYTRTQYACISTDDETVFALAFKNFDNDKNDYRIEKVGDVYLISKKTEKRLKYDQCPIYEQVVAGSIINLLELVRKAYDTDKSELLGVNTDSCFIYNAKEVETTPRSEFEEQETMKDLEGHKYSITKTKKDIKMLSYLGKYSTEDIKLKVFHSVEEIEGNQKEEFKIMTHESKRKGQREALERFSSLTSKPLGFEGRITYGGAGCGKTWTMCNEIIEAFKEHKKFLVLSFTNKSVKNIKNTLKKVIKRKKINISKQDRLKIQKKIRTFHKVYYMCQQSEKEMTKKLSHQNKIFVDEFVMTPNQFMTMLYQSESEIHLFGDPNQLEPVDDYVYDYSNSPAIKEMCPEIRVLKYIKGCCRFDNELLKKSKKFLKDGLIPLGFMKVNENLYKNICYTNRMRRIINADRCQKFISEKKCKGTEISCWFHYDDHKKPDVKEIYNFCEGMPVIATQNIDYADICNSETYTIDKIENDTVYLNHHFKLKNKKVQFSLTFPKFGQAFLPAFCVTAHKYQGDTIDEPYNIYEVTRMNKKLFYTAMTRATKFKNIHIDGVQKEFTTDAKPDDYEKLCDKGGKYKNGKVYEIDFQDGTYYVGKTCKSIEKRFEGHKKDPHSPVFNNKDAKIKLLYNYPCFTNLELLKVEAMEISRYIKKYGAKNVKNKQRNNHLRTTQIEIKDMPKVEGEEREKAKELKKKLDFTGLRIQENTKRKYFRIRKVIRGVTYEKRARYKEQPRDKALKEITEWRENILKNI
jgi:hypothetical protein